MDRPFCVLSVDGGGIRGIVPALVLTEIERRTGRPVSSSFDLIAGTSTGGIIALGVTKPNAQGEPEYRASDIVELYEGKGKRIFSAPILHQLTSAWGLLDEKYPAEEVEKVFQEYFGEARLKDALTDVFVTSFEIQLRSPWFFRSRRAKTDAEYDFPMKKVARATSAAPTYFEPLRLEAASGEHWALVDGGVYANNPTMCALVEARTAYGADDVLVVSLGTGEPTVGYAWKDAKDWGLARWARPLLDVMFEGESDTVDFQTAQLCQPVGGEPRYFRFQVQIPDLKSDVDDIDDASDTTVRELRRLTEAAIEAQDSRLDALCAMLTSASTAAVT
jgi:patatin-like phospholipase/acyl hydrolase